MIEEIAEDLYRIEVSLPEHFLRSLNIYVLRDKNRSLVIDGGIQDKRCLDTVQEAVRELNIDLEKTDFFITHGHGDHVGLIPWLVRAGSIIYLNRLEAEYIEATQSGMFSSEIKDLYETSGLPENGFEEIVSTLVRPSLTSKDTRRFRFLGNGDIITRDKYRFICIETPGHSKGHTCLYDPEEKILVSGDHLLKDVFSPIFGKVDSENPLKEYLLSLDKVHELDIDTVLPGHGQPFDNSMCRIKETTEYHHQQNRTILSVLRQGSMNMYEISLRTARTRNSSSAAPLTILQSFFAVEEVFTHLKYLEEEGRTKRTTEGKASIYSLCEDA